MHIFADENIRSRKAILPASHSDKPPEQSRSFLGYQAQKNSPQEFVVGDLRRTHPQPLSFKRGEKGIWVISLFPGFTPKAPSISSLRDFMAPRLLI
jgi:hypothetical protein